MDSAGNDVVSLAEIDVLKTKTSKFYSKILSVTEVDGYYKPNLHTIPFEHYVWLLWAMKEAAYKFLKRIDPELNFIPVKFLVKDIHIPGPNVVAIFNIYPTTEGTSKDAFYRAIVEIGGYVIYSAAAISEKLIFAVVSDNYNFDNVFCGVETINDPNPANQSSSARELLQKAVSKATGYSGLFFQKDSHGIPVLYDEGKGITILVSIAHHGRYVGYSFKYDKAYKSKVPEAPTE